MRPIIRSPMYVSTSKLCPRTASTPAPDGGATASGRSSPRIAMHSLQGSRWVRLILGTVAVAACTREAPNREGEAKGGAIVPSHFTQLTMVHDRLWVTTDAGIVVIEPVAEKWTWLDVGSPRIVPTSVVSCGSDIWLRLEDSLALLDLKTRSLRISATMGARQPGGPEEPLTTRLSPTAREVCGPSALWVYDSGSCSRRRSPGA